MRCHSVHEGDVPVRNLLAADNVYIAGGQLQGKWENASPHASNAEDG